MSNQTNPAHKLDQLRKKAANKELLTEEDVTTAADVAKALGSYESRVVYTKIKKSVEVETGSDE